jgi:lipopolysaccharide biosynthesis regulator YciM
MPADAGEVFWWTLAATLAIGWGWTIVQTLRNRRRRARRREQHLEGLRYLLDDKPDRALEVFLGLAATDDEAIDTHFALGSLYRRRGEVDRAIKVHEHIIGRRGIDARHREAARIELARDYFRAGLYDRAETLFEQLSGEGHDPATALEYLVRIHELQHDWPQAAATHLRLQRVGVPDEPSSIAHYYCELAEEALANRRVDEALRLLDQADAQQPSFGRAAILRGDVAMLEGDAPRAIRLYQGVVRQDFHLLPLVLPKLADAIRNDGDAAELGRALEELARNGTASRAEIAYAAILSGYYDDPAIIDCVREWLRTDSDLRDVTSALLPPGREPDETQLRAVAAALRNVVERHARYRCSDCGLDSSTFLWQCPGCKSWDTLRAIAALEFLPRAARPRSRG